MQSGGALIFVNFFVKFFSCSGIYASELCGAIVSDLRPPIIEDFKHNDRKKMLVRTSSEKSTLYVSSG